jgi:hypothetical protein
LPASPYENSVIMQEPLLTGLALAETVAGSFSFEAS